MARLLWKEWREVWPILAGAAALVAAAFAAWHGTEHVGRAGPWCVVGVFGLLMGGRAFASDAERGTDAFLLAQPVERDRVWLAKAAFAVGLPLLMAGSTFVVEVLSYDPPHSIGLTQPPDWASFLLLALAVTAGTASLALLCSTVIPTTLTASLAGAGCAWLIVVGVLQYHEWQWGIGTPLRLRRPPPAPFDAVTVAVAVALLVAAAALWTSRLAFRRQPVAR